MAKGGEPQYFWDQSYIRMVGETEMVHLKTFWGFMFLRACFILLLLLIVTTDCTPIPHPPPPMCYLIKRSL